MTIADAFSPTPPEIVAASADARVALAKALAAVQAELPHVEKTRKADVYNKENRYLYSYNYADLADVSAAIMPVLGRHGLAFACLPTEEGGKFGLRYTLLHEGGGSLTGWYPIERSTEQITGGRITYARRFVLSAITGVAAEEDVDAVDTSRPPRRQQPQGQPDQPPQRTAQRRTQNPAARPAATSSPEAAAAPQAAPPVSSPPLPGEEGYERTEQPDPTDGPVRDHLPSTRSSDEADYDTPGTVTPAMLRKIGAMFTEMGYGAAQRAERLSLSGRITGRTLGSGSDMSYNEARQLIEFVERDCGTDYGRVEAALIQRENE